MGILGSEKGQIDDNEDEGHSHQQNTMLPGNPLGVGNQR